MKIIDSSPGQEVRGEKFEGGGTGDGAQGLRRPTLGLRTVERLHALLAGDPVTEGMVLTFIGARYEARNLFFLSAKVAEQVLRRPTDFMRAAKQFCEPQLPF